MGNIFDINKRLEKLSTTLELAGQRMVIASLNDRDCLVAQLCTWYVLGRTRPAFDKLVTFVAFITVDLI